ncbi:hypothetical protein [Kordiimonas marina]|uniref:hypothetical protein n=1 Tax=Kordiimonas marina TaxID=2872312 RepID=UPI001FF10609|nr:hypothetical protein [Kordiimonas marina]MCJ9428224.1 hypothetical protein [Kordiimonas marina]
MKFGSAKNLFPLVLCGLLAACAGRGDTWPTLSEPLPDQSARTKPLHPAKKPADQQRASTHAEPAAPTRRTEDTLPKTAAEADALLTEIKTDLKADTLAYREAVAKVDEAAAEARLDAWYDAQAALTRLSQTASRLDKLIAATDPALASVAEAAESQAGIIEKFVVDERQRLAGLKPQS